MTLLTPLGLALALTLPVLVLLYLLKIRPQNREVGSIYLWERLLPELAAHQPWQKPRFPPLFFLQAVVLTALVLAISRPAVQALADEAVFDVVVLDASASMKATDEQPNRFARAREQAHETVLGLSEGSTVALIVAGSGPAVLAPETADRTSLLSALDRAEPTDAAGNLTDAIRLAAALAQNRERARIDVFTDGAVDLPPDLTGLAVPLVWHTVGHPTFNRGVTEFSARPDPESQRRQQAFLRVQRFGESVGHDDGAVLVTLVALEPNGEQILESRSLTFDAEGVAETVFDDLPDTAQVVEARLSGGDALATDDRAGLVPARPRATRVLLVSRGNLFLEKALGLLPNVVVDRISPRGFGAILPEEYDVLVLDTDVPDILPDRSLLIVNPTGSALLPIEGYLRQPSIVAWERDHPLLRHVDLTEMRFTRAPQIGVPGWAQPVVESTGGPLLLAGSEQGRRIVVFAFDLQRSNLALTPSFPILVANAIGYLEPPGLVSNHTVTPGGEVTLSPSTEAQRVVVRSPSGEDATLEVTGPTLTFADTTQVGLYRVAQRVGDQTLSESVFAVNLLNALESDVRPRALPTLGQAAATRASQATARDLWTWPLVLGFAFVLVEWWWYHRR